MCQIFKNLETENVALNSTSSPWTQSIFSGFKSRWAIPVTKRKCENDVSQMIWPKRLLLLLKSTAQINLLIGQKSQIATGNICYVKFFFFSMLSRFVFPPKYNSKHQILSFLKKFKTFCNISQESETKFLILCHQGFKKTKYLFTMDWKQFFFNKSCAQRTMKYLCHEETLQQLQYLSEQG